MNIWAALKSVVAGRSLTFPILKVTLPTGYTKPLKEALTEMDYAEILKRRNKLVSVIHHAFTDWAFKDHDDKTRTMCNLAAHQVARDLGCSDLYSQAASRPMLANEIYDFMLKSRDWGEVQMSEAQQYANQGYLVFAVAKGKPSGHIATICPGLEQESKRWVKVPAVMNVGAVNAIGKGLNWCFSEIPKFYLWRNGK
jgi:hypothetical protein